MVNTLLFDFSRVILFPKDKAYIGDLNPLHAELRKNTGYRFLDYFELNTDLMRFLREIKSKYELYIFTSGSIQDAPEIQPELRGIFAKVYSAERIGYSKRDPASYKFIAGDLHKKPDEILFVDDAATNIQAAKTAGLETLLFTSTQDAIAKIKQVLS